MKTIKVLLFLLILPAVMMSNVTTPLAGPAQVKKHQAKRIIRKTAVVILIAHKKVKEGKVYTGNLARAISHQKFAIHLYKTGKYFRAIHHSRRARMLALAAIKANKGGETSDMNYSKEDEALFKAGPNDEELDKDLAAARPTEPTKDEDIIGAEPAVDLSEKE